MEEKKKVKKSREIQEVHAQFVSLVDRAANKHTFAIAKNKGGIKDMNEMRSYTYGQARNVVMEQIGELEKAVKDIDAAIKFCNNGDVNQEFDAGKAALSHVVKACRHASGLKLDENVQEVEKHYLHGIL